MRSGKEMSFRLKKRDFWMLCTDWIGKRNHGKTYGTGERYEYKNRDIWLRKIGT